MLSALSDTDPKVANGALAAAMLRLVGRPQAPVSEEFRQISDSVLSEARAKLGLTEDDRRPESLEKIRSFLSEEVDKILLGSRDRENILDRLGSSGDLPLGVYEIRSTQEFRSGRERLNFAKDCIVNCEDLLHLLPEDEGDKKQWSIFSKSIYDKRGNLNFYVLVQAMREGHALSVTNLWRISPKIVDVSSVKPIDLLKSFVTHYGIELVVNGKNTGKKILLDEVIPITSHNDGLSIGPVPMEGVSKTDLSLLFKIDMGAAKVRYAFVVDSARYKKDVKRLSSSRI